MTSSQVQPPERRAYIVAQPTHASLFVEAQRAAAAGASALEHFGAARWRDANRAFWGQNDEALGALERARELLNSGQNAYLNLDFEGAVRDLSGAVSDFDRAESVLGDTNDFAQTLLYLGASLVIEGRAREAEQAFRRLHVQMPEIHPDPNVFNPEIVAQFEAARPNGRNEVTIRVESDPPGAAVHIDFQLRGVTPLDVSDLPAGEHVVRITRFGAMPFVQHVTVAARGSERVSAHFIPQEPLANLPDSLSELGTADIESEAARAAVTRIAHSLEVDVLGVVRIASARARDQVNVDFVLFDASGQQMARDGGLVSRAPEALERGVEQLVTGVLEAGWRTLVESPTSTSAVAHSDGDERSIAEEWWFWTIVGGAALVVGASIGIGVGLSEQQPESRGHIVFEF
jgi:tetratricopeptide (TPR) repeat protein